MFIRYNCRFVIKPSGPVVELVDALDSDDRESNQTFDKFGLKLSALGETLGVEPPKFGEGFLFQL